jgi:hypothetical protein
MAVKSLKVDFSPVRFDPMITFGTLMLFQTFVELTVVVLLFEYA